MHETQLSTESFRLRAYWRRKDKEYLDEVAAGKPARVALPGHKPAPRPLRPLPASERALLIWDEEDGGGEVPLRELHGGEEAADIQAWQDDACLVAGQGVARTT